MFSSFLWRDVTFDLITKKVITPTRLSLLFVAENASTAHISVIKSFLLALTVPNNELALISTNNITVSSLSSSNNLLNGCPKRADTFQSINRTSSPGAYSRTSRKVPAMPRPFEGTMIFARKNVACQALAFDFQLADFF